MKILILTQYFPPETGAPQNRLFELALKLQSLGARVSVLTALPNYPKYQVFDGYGGWYSKSEMSGLEVHRSWIFARPGKGMLLRLLNYFSFVCSSLWAGWFKVEKPDLIICESPPLFLGWTAVLLKRRHGARLLFNVSDLWPESAVKLGLVRNRFILGASTRLEEWIYRNADLISGQTQGIVRNIHRRFPDKPCFWLKNGVDAQELYQRLSGHNWRKAQHFQENDLLLYFGGLMGYAQGLDTLLEAAALVQDLPEVKFVLIGDGPEKARLIAKQQEMGLKQVYFFDGVRKDQIADVIHSIDVGLIPLRKLELFEGAIPSKIFEILCLKKPVLLGIRGEAQTLFIEEGDAGWAFEPENAEALAENIRFVYHNRAVLAEKGENGYRYVNNHFDRTRIAADFWAFIQE